MVTALAGGALHVYGGRPGPTKRLSPEHRQANMLMLRFQDALAEERWQDALSLCSDRIRAKAAEWPSLGAFFNETIPIEGLLAEKFGPWSLSSGAYGLFVPLTPPTHPKKTSAEPEPNQALQWLWAIVAATNKTWVVDYPPIKLEDCIAQKLKAIRERDERIQSIDKSLEPQVKGIKTRLTAVSERFVIGSPMLFRVEAINLGDTLVHFRNAGVGFHPLTVLNSRKEPVPFIQMNAQIGVGESKIAPGASVVLADKIDLNNRYAITNTGTYFVQFSGAGFLLGEPLPHQDRGLFGENLSIGFGDFLSTTNNFPSEMLKIEVSAAQ
jgi:hypothetical protein